MNPASIFATLRRRGAHLHLVEGDRLAVAPKGALDDGLRAAIREQKPALVAMLKTKGAPPDLTVLLPPCSSCSSVVFWRRDGEVTLQCATCNLCDDRSRAVWYTAVAADHPFAELFDPDARAACAWMARQRPDVVDRLLALERRCEQLATDLNPIAFRAAVAELVDYVRQLRAEYEAGDA